MNEIDFFKVQVKVVTYENMMEVAEFLSKKTGLRVDKLSGLINGLFVRVNKTNNWVSNFYESDEYQTINYEQFKEQYMTDKDYVTGVSKPIKIYDYDNLPVKEPVKEPVKTVLKEVVIHSALNNGAGKTVAVMKTLDDKCEMVSIMLPVSSDELRAIADYLDSKNNQ